MKRRPWFAWVSLVARLVLGGVMLVAGALKVTDPETAAQAVRAYELLPSRRWRRRSAGGCRSWRSRSDCC